MSHFVYVLLCSNPITFISEILLKRFQCPDSIIFEQRQNWKRYCTLSSKMLSAITLPNFKQIRLNLIPEVHACNNWSLNYGLLSDGLHLQKAFDTVNHAIMSDKLGAIGCDDGSVKWFNSYLSNRSQFIDIKGTL